MSEQWGDRGIDWEPMVSQREHVIKGGGEYRCLVCETRCGEDGHCRCCLAAEVEALRKERDRFANQLVNEVPGSYIAMKERALTAEEQVQRVWEVWNVWGPREATDETHRMYKELQAALDGPA
jgi:hypothetical protein